MSRPTDAELNLRMAHAVIILGIDQHDVASIFSVNSGRVAEAVKAVRMAIADPVKFAERAKPVPVPSAPQTEAEVTLTTLLEDLDKGPATPWLMSSQ